METPKFFEGIVAEDPSSDLGTNADNPQIGRVLVREILGHSNRVDSEDLIPATIMMPSNSGGFGGVGVSPTGLLKGTRVICMKLGGFTYVMGVVNVAPEGNHSVSSYARGQGEPELKSQNRIDGIEPDSKYAARYPFNNTITTRSGHLIEYDDTPGAERIQLFHKTGSYIEILPDGSVISKSVKDSYQLSDGSLGILTVGKNKDIEIASNDGKIIIAAKADIAIYSDDGNVSVESKTGNVNVKSETNVTINSPKVKIESPDSELTGNLTVNGQIIGKLSYGTF